MRGVVILCFFCLSVRCFWSQDPMHVVFDDGNGCYDFEQYDLLQDDKGYIWIAGNSGAFKYNAKQFHHYESQLSPSRSLTGLSQDKFGRIWMHDFAGNVFYVQDDKLIPFKLWKSSNSRTFPVIRTSGEKLWIIAEESVVEFCNHKNIDGIKKIRKWDISTSREAISFDGKLFVSGENEIWSIGKRLNKLKIEGIHSPEFLKAWSSFFIFKKKLYLFARSENTIYSFDGSHFLKVKTLPVFGDFISLRVIQNQPFILTRNGLIRLNSTFEPVEHLFNGRACSELILDKQGGYWLSTLNEGIIHIPDIRTRILNHSNTSGFNKLVIWNNKLIAGTNNGRLFQLVDDKMIQIYTSKQQKEISFLNLNQFSNALFFGDYNLHVYGQNLRDLGVNPSIKQVKMLSENMALVADPSGLYVRSFSDKSLLFDNLPEYLKKHVRKRRINGSNVDVYVLLDERTSSFYLWKENLLAATKNGLYLINNKKKKRQYFLGKPIFATDFEWVNGLLYVATSNQGLLTWNGKEWRKVNLDETHTPFTFIQHIAFANDELWLATDVGIIQWNLTTKKQQIIDQSNGLITTRITDMIVFKGSIYLSTTKGILKFPTKFLVKTMSQPPLYFSSLKINGKTVKNEQLKRIESNPGIVSLQFDVLSYGNLNRLILSYQLDNETKWMTLNPGSFTINLTKPQSGKHQIKIKLIDRVTGENLQSRKLNFYIQPTFFQYFWVQLSLVAILLGIFVTLIWWYIRTIKRKNKQLVEKERLERELKQSMLSAINAQMNPHFIFNALNTIQSYILTNDRMQANFYLGKFSDLMRRILTMSNQDAITLEEEFEALKLYLELENMRLNNELNVEMDHSTISNLFHKKIPSMIIQPYIENAIKHGLLHFQGPKKLTISFSCASSEILTVIVTDYGIGRTASFKMKQRSGNRYRSFSTDANKKRLDLLNEKGHDGISVAVEDLENFGHQTGTRVILRIPFK